MTRPFAGTFIRLAFPLALAATAASAQARVLLPVLDARSVNALCTRTLEQAAQRVKALQKLPVERATTRTVLHAWNDLQIGSEDAMGPIDLQGNVHPDKKVRDAAEACLLKFTTFTTELYQNEALYRRIVAVQPGDPASTKLRKDLIESFEDTGVSLPRDKRARAKEIFQRIEVLRQEFDRNVRDDKTRVSFTAEEMAGLPAAYLAQSQRDDKGNYLLGFEYPSYRPFMQLADGEAARKRYYMAFQSRGGQRNIGLMNQLMQLRFELAQLYGLSSYAEFVTRRKMVENPARVEAFLMDVKGALTDIERREADELRSMKAQSLGRKAEEVAFGRWDVDYWQEKARKARFAIDQEALRKYFPSQASIDFSLAVASRLYGVKFRRASVPVWHQDVVYYDVLDAASGKYLAGIYIDAYPRAGKYGHAAAWPVRAVSRIAGRTPVSVLVTNFNREGLNHDELETLLHEFGHVLHGVLSTTQYNPHGGTATVNDFVEAPSQMFEEWARRPESLALFQQVCSTCAPLAPDLIQRLEDARRFGRGLWFGRQHLYATFDMALAGPHPPEALATWIAIESASPLGHADGTMFPANFSHLMAQYGGGYYGYMWSQVIALDMLSAFGENIMNPVVGRRFRDTILANGGQEPARQLVERFLGRPVSSQAFFAEIAGTRAMGRSVPADARR